MFLSKNLIDIEKAKKLNLTEERAIIRFIKDISETMSYDKIKSLILIELKKIKPIKK